MECQYLCDNHVMRDRMVLELQKIVTSSEYYKSSSPEEREEAMALLDKVERKEVEGEVERGSDRLQIMLNSYDEHQREEVSL